MITQQTYKKIKTTLAHGVTVSLDDARALMASFEETWRAADAAIGLCPMPDGSQPDAVLYDDDGNARLRLESPLSPIAGL